MSRPEFAAAREAAARLRAELALIFPGASGDQLDTAVLACGCYAARLVEVHARPAAGAGLLLPEREAS